MSTKIQLLSCPAIIFLLVNSLFAQSPGCIGACENTYTEAYFVAMDNYNACVTSPPPGGISECINNRDAALAQAESDRLNCTSACQTTGPGTPPNDVSIFSSDLARITQFDTVSGLIELGILSEESNFQQFSLQTTLPIAVGYNGQWDFGFGIYSTRNIRPDLFCYKKTGTGTGMVEVHVLSGQSNYQSFLNQKATTIPSSIDWEFITGLQNTSLDPQHPSNYPLYGRVIAIHKQNTPSGNTEISILSEGTNNFYVSLSTPLPLPQTDSTWKFGTGDWDNDAVADLIAIHPLNGSGTEIIVFSGASNYQNIIVNNLLPVSVSAAQEWDIFAAQYTATPTGDGEPEIFFVNKGGNAGSNMLLNVNYDSTSGYLSFFEQNRSLPFEPDLDAEIIGAPSYQCSFICPQ